jgi:F-type H+-transporting ATPase subunit epsilon
MASGNTFQLDVVTPERVVLSCRATYVAFPAFDGEMGVLAHRAPLVAKLGTGVLRVESGNDKRRLFVDGGFAQMVGDKLTILTESAREPEAIDPAAVERELVAARALVVRDDASVARRDRAYARVRAQRTIGGR